jgi:dihydrodipicolinate synthase/N-acetylneuraminate lyase
MTDHVKTLGGAWPTIVTRYQADLKENFGAYRETVRGYNANGLGGAFANVNWSEMCRLGNDERLLLISEATKTGHPCQPWGICIVFSPMANRR